MTYFYFTIFCYVSVIFYLLFYYQIFFEFIIFICQARNSPCNLFILQFHISISFRYFVLLFHFGISFCDQIFNFICCFILLPYFLLCSFQCFVLSSELFFLKLYYSLLQFNCYSNFSLLYRR